MTRPKEHAWDTVSLVCQCRLLLSTHILHYLSDLLRRHLKAIRSRWRALSPGRIAVIVLAVLRHDQRLTDMADGNDISATRRDRILAHLRAAGLGAPTDPDFLGLDDDGDDPGFVTRFKGLPSPQARIRREGGQSGPGRRTRPRRTRLCPPEELADAHQGRN
ncbi:hypothetical protein [Streptomyces cupreus]|uniref:hypothetical protein n=1 Tax=Streptomyces cupreus TaxID=2759956 RepID=UPI00300C0B8C